MDTFVCRCDWCHRLFNGDDLVEKTYQEYEGASNQSYFVSPCCQSGYEEVGDFANGETLIDNKGGQNDKT